MELETRKSDDKAKEEGNRLSGYAILYGVESREIFEYGKRFTEVIERGAFNLNDNGDDDIKLYFQHDTKMPLARTKGGSLRLFEDEKGIRFEADLPDTTLANDVKELMKRGILTGEMSFGFGVERDEWEKSRTLRKVKKARLYEVSVVVDAAYAQTFSQLRSVIQDITSKRIQTIRRRFK
jgi:HK97 family phage prohead protease